MKSVFCKKCFRQLAPMTKDWGRELVCERCYRKIRRNARALIMTGCHK